MRIFIIILFFLNIILANAQCPCSMGAAVGGLTPIGGTVNVGVLREGFIRATFLYNYGYGEEYFHNDIRIEKKDFTTEKIIHSKEYRNHFLGFLFSYGLTNKLTIESELGYFPQKFQTISEYSSSYFDVLSRGFSHFVLSGKYNVFYDLGSDIEFTAGAGLMMPLDFAKDTLPYNLYSSNGNYAVVLQSFLHKGFKRENLHLMLYNKFIGNFAYTREYKQGNSLQNSLFLAQGFSRNISGILELRHEYYSRDKYQNEIIHDSGANIISISPQVYLVFDELNISFYMAIPLYRYYFGEQLATKYNIGANITYQMKITGD